MEVLLNLGWILFAASLGVWSLHALRRGTVRLSMVTIIALGLLVMLMLPAISMTDDLMAMNAPAEVLHGLEAPALSPLPLAAGTLVFSVALVLRPTPGTAPDRTVAANMRLRAFSSVALSGFVRAFGVRPPTRVSLPGRLLCA